MVKLNYSNASCLAFALLFASSLHGQVAIGTTTPTAGTKFEIVGTGTTSSTAALRVRNSTSSTPLLLIRDDGKVSIGNTNNIHKLDVSGNARIENYLHSSYNNEILAGVDASGYFFASGSGLNSSNIPIYIGSRNSDIRFTTSSSIYAGTEKMRITSDGNVGIGTIFPNATLDLRTNPTSTSDPGAGYLGVGTTSSGANTAGAGAVRYSTSSGGILEYSNGNTWNTLSSNSKLISSYTLSDEITSNTTIVTLYDVFRINSSSSPITLILPEIATLGTYSYKAKLTFSDVGGNASTNHITIQTSGGNTIAGSNSFVINTNYSSTTIVSDANSKWIIL